MLHERVNDYITRCPDSIDAGRDSVGRSLKNPSEDVPNNLVFHVYCKIKLISALVIWFDLSKMI